MKNKGSRELVPTSASGFGQMRQFGMPFQGFGGGMSLLDNFMSFSPIHEMMMGMQMPALGSDATGGEGSPFMMYSASFSSMDRVGPDGKVVRQKYMSNGMAQRGHDGQVISERAQAYRNSNGIDRTGHERMLGEQGRKVVRERNRLGEEDETNHFHNLDYADVQGFDSRWNQASERSGFGRNISALRAELGGQLGHFSNFGIQPQRSQRRGSSQLLAPRAIEQPPYVPRGYQERVPNPYTEPVAGGRQPYDRFGPSYETSRRPYAGGPELRTYQPYMPADRGGFRYEPQRQLHSGYGQTIGQSLPRQSFGRMGPFGTGMYQPGGMYPPGAGPMGGGSRPWPNYRQN